MSSGKDDKGLRRRGQVTRPFPPSRRLVTAAVRAGRRIVPMHGLLEVDITEARRLLAEASPPSSLTAFVIASVGRAAAKHPEVHAYRDWRGRLVTHRHVDVQTLVEIPTPEGPFGLVHVVRDADIRGVADITAELQAVKREPATTTSGRMLTHLAPVGGRIPGLYAVMFALMSRSRRVRLATGTVQVTAVGMFADGAGFAIAPPTAPRAPSSSGEWIADRGCSTATYTYATCSTSRSPLTTTSPTAPQRPASEPSYAG